MYQDFAAVITAQSAKNNGYWVFNHKWDAYIIPSQAMEQLRKWEDLTARGEVYGRRVTLTFALLNSEQLGLPCKTGSTDLDCGETPEAMPRPKSLYAANG